MGILSEQAEHDLAVGALERLDKLIELRERQQTEFPYLKQADLKRKLGISNKYLAKLKVHGLKSAILEEGDSYVWYKVSDVVDLMDTIAE